MTSGSIARQKWRSDADVQRQKVLSSPFLLSALSVAFAHGGNDVGNAVGPLASIYEIYSSGNVETTPEIPFGRSLLARAGLCLGSTPWVIEQSTLLKQITKPTFTVLCDTNGRSCGSLGSSVLGMPVSTSHCLVGAVVESAWHSVTVDLPVARRLNFKMLQKLLLVGS